MSANAHTHCFDVAIVGGGPAGCIAALLLARSGALVVMVARGKPTFDLVAQSISPQTKTQLSAIGLHRIFESGRHLQSPGIVSLWGHERAGSNDFFFHPYGNGWHIDRVDFDDALKKMVIEMGVRWCDRARIEGIQQDAAGYWQFVVAAGKGTEFRANSIIDATGRTSVVARSLGIGRVRADRLIAVGAQYLKSHRFDGDVRLSIEAVENGWWYAVPLFEDKLSVVFMTDSEALRSFRSAEHLWQNGLERSELTRQRTAEYRRVGQLTIVAANSSRIEQTSGRGWFTVGDATMTVDPLSGQGLSNSVESATMIARLLIDGPLQERAASHLYNEWAEARWRAYETGIREYYQSERRWSSSGFWQRRHANLTS
jgi:flavin-dependent dehydrogenase